MKKTITAIAAALLLVAFGGTTASPAITMAT